MVIYQLVKMNMLMMRFLLICLISLMANPVCGQKRTVLKTLAETFGKAGAAYQGSTQSQGLIRRNIISGTFPFTGDKFPSIADNLNFENNPATSPAIDLKIDERSLFLLKETRKHEEEYKAQTDSITNMMLETINESNCDSCLLHVFFLDGYTTMFNIHQSRGSNNVNIASIDSLEVCSTSYLGVYSEYSTEPQYGIKVECYKTGEPVSKEKVEELADRVARFLKFYKFVMESPHYNFPMLTVPPHLINRTPKQ